MGIHVQCHVHIGMFYHFAWDGNSGLQRGNFSTQLLNVEYTCNVAMVAKQLGCERFISIGTITENIAKENLDGVATFSGFIYGLSKLHTHNLLDIICKNIGLKYVWVQLSNIYGGDNSTGNLISYTLSELRAGRIPTYGPCNQPYNFTHIDDVIEALHLIGTVEQVEEKYVVSNGDVRLLHEYLEIIGKVYDKKLGIGERADEGIRINREWFSCEALTRIGFQAKKDFEQEIRKSCKDEK